MSLRAREHKYQPFHIGLRGHLKHSEILDVLFQGKVQGEKM